MSATGSTTTSSVQSMPCLLVARCPLGTLPTSGDREVSGEAQHPGDHDRVDAAAAGEGDPVAALPGVGAAEVHDELPADQRLPTTRHQGTAVLAGDLPPDGRRAAEAGGPADDLEPGLRHATLLHARHRDRRP